MARSCPKRQQAADADAAARANLVWALLNHNDFVTVAMSRALPTRSIMTATCDIDSCRGIHRRAFLADLGMGFTGLALGAMLHRDGYGQRAATGRRPTASRTSPPKAKSVIWLFMNGGVSHMESFDPKPMLTKYAGKTIAETPFEDVQDPEEAELIARLVVNDANGQAAQHALSAAGRLQEVRPERHRGQRLVAAHRRGMSTTSPSSARCGRPTTTTGRRRSSTPAGTCSTASSRRSAPGSTTASARSTTTCRSSSRWATASTGTRRTATTSARRTTRCRCASIPSNPLDFGQPERPFAPQEQQVGFDLVGELNRLRAVEYPDDPALAARIKSYELAFRMQTSVPEVLDFTQETERDEEALRPRPAATPRLRHAAAGGAAAGRARRALHPDPARRPAAPAPGMPTAA